MRGLDLLGAVGGASGLRTQTIVMKIEDVDANMFRKALAAEKVNSAVAPVTLFAIDHAPKLVVDYALAYGARMLTKYGITAKLSVVDGGVGEPRAASEFIPGAIAGGIAGVVVALTAKGIVRFVSNLL